jgi:tetratricopeptide (TPR) repeat protein
LARLLELSPDDKDLVVTASKYYRRTGRPERSLEVTTRYARSRRTAEARANAQILVASHYLGLGELDLVEQTLLTAADTAETLEVVQSLADFYLHRLDRPDQALPWFDKAVARARARGSDRLPAVMAARVSCLLHRKLNDTKLARDAVANLRATAPDYPQGLLLESEVYAREGRIDKAIDSLTEYLTQRPGDPYALYQRALHQYAEGKPEQAVQDLQTLKHVSPLALDLRPRLLLARLHQQAGRHDQQLRELESLVRETPDSVEALEELVRAYIDRGGSADAERFVTAQINRTAGKPDARWLFLRGRISVEVGDYAKALSDFRHAAEIDGHSAESLTRVLDLYLRMNRPGEGIDYYQHYVRPDRVTSTLESRHALLLVKADRTQEAVEHFRHAMGLALGDGRTAVAVVASDLRAAFPPVEPSFESVNEAIALFEDRPPDGAAARVNDRILARLYRMAVRYEEAANRLERLVATCTNDHERVDLLFELAELYHTAGDAQAARRTYEEGLKYDPDNWIALNNLAYLLSDELAEYELARPYAQRAVAYSDNPATLDTLGWIYVGLGQYSLAVAELSRAIRLAPDDPLTYLHLGEAYRRNGQFTAAANILTSGRELAEATGSVDLTARFDASQDRVARADRSP